MATGAEDYWQSSNRLMAGLMESIKSGLLTGSDLLNKLDNLDGVEDGRLDLGILNTALSTDATETVLKQLKTSITKLNDQIDKLTEIDSNVAKGIFNNYYKVDTSLDTIIDVSASTSIVYLFRGNTHPANTANVTFYLYLDAVLKQTFVIPSGSYKFYWETVQQNYWNIIKVQAASGEQYYQFFSPWEV